MALFPRCFDALLLLVERRGELLDKDFLLHALWPDVVVEENSLAKVISDIRRALGETRDGGCIETVPRRGYRFIAKVGVLRSAREHGSRERPAARHPRAGRAASHLSEPGARRRDSQSRPGRRADHALRTTAPHRGPSHLVDHALRGNVVRAGAGGPRARRRRRDHGHHPARRQHRARQRAAGLRGGRRGVLGGEVRRRGFEHAGARGFDRRARGDRAHAGTGARRAAATAAPSRRPGRVRTLHPRALPDRQAHARLAAGSHCLPRARHRHRCALRAGARGTERSLDTSRPARRGLAEPAAARDHAEGTRRGRKGAGAR